MIYEIFSSMFQNAGSPWLAFAGSIICSAYALWLLGWAADGLYMYSVHYVFEGAKTQPSFMYKVCKKLTGSADISELPDGWYRSINLDCSKDWRFRHIINGEVIASTDNICFTENLRGVPSLTANLPMVRDIRLFVWIGPVVLSVLFLLLDTFPVAAVCIAGYVLALKAVRKIVRIGDRINKHVSDNELHAQRSDNET